MVWVRNEEGLAGTAEYYGQRCTALAIGAGGAQARESIRREFAVDRPGLLLGGCPSKWRAYGVGAGIGLLLDDLGFGGGAGFVAAGEPRDAHLQLLTLREEL